MREGTGRGSQGANQDEMSPCRLQEERQLCDTANHPGVKWDAALSHGANESIPVLSAPAVA